MRVSIPRTFFVCVGVPLLVVSLMSAFLSPAPRWSFLGAHMEVGTVASIGMFVLVLALASLIPRRYLRLCAALLALVLVGVLASGWFFDHHVEVRPSLTATGLVTVPLYAESLPHALVGEGPYMFDAVWQKYRPLGANEVPWWDASFFYGYSTASTFAATLGILGVLALFVMFAPAIALGYTLVRTRSVSTGSVLSAGVALVVLVVLCVTIVSSTLWYLGAAALGLCVRSLTRNFFVLGGWRLWLSGATVVLLLAALGWVGVHQTLAASTHERGVVAYQTKVFDAAELLGQAAAWWETPQYDRDASRATLEAAFSVYETQKDEKGLKFQANNALSYANRAVQADPVDYPSWLSRASLLGTLASVGYPKAAEEAEFSLLAAEKLAPLRPEVAYLRAVLAKQQGDKMGARSYAQQSLHLKTDYNPALQLLKQLDVQN